jgi:hypothetical protein
MNEENVDFPDLIWSCFINWLNTLEKVGNLKSFQDKSQEEILENTK